MCAFGELEKTLQEELEDKLEKSVLERLEEVYNEDRKVSVSSTTKENLERMLTNLKRGMIMRNIFRRKVKGTTYVVTEIYVNSYLIIKERVIKTHNNLDNAVEYIDACRDINPHGKYYICVNHVN